MILSTIVFAASLACRPGDAPFLALPAPAVTNGELRTASIPGAVPFASAALRLDGHAMSAMYGAAEALWQRAVIPSLTDCGPLRTNGVSALRTCDFAGVTDGAAALYLMGDYAYASNRNLSASGRRFGRGLRDLLDVNVYGGSGGLGFASAFGANPLTGDAYWLVPDIDHAAQPTGKWCLDDETKTADWTKYLVMLGELDARGVFDEDGTPYAVPVSLGITGSRDWDGYMQEGGFRTLGDVYGKDFGYGRTYGVCPSGTARGAAITNMTLKALLGGLASGARVEGVATQKTARVWWNRFALADAATAACSTLLDTCQSVSFYSQDDERAGYASPDERGFSYVLRREEVSGRVSGTLTLRAEGDGVGFGGQGAPSGGGSGSFVAFIDWEKFVSAGLVQSDDVTAATTTVGRATAAWCDSEGSGSASLATSAAVKVSDLDLDSTALGGVVAAGDYGLGYAISADERGDYTFGLYLDASAGFAKVGTFRWPAPECWTSTVTVAYSANVSGVETLGPRLPLVGPTWHETPNYVPWAGQESRRTVVGAGYHPLCFDGGMLKSADVHSFAACGISTNEAAIPGVAAGGDFPWGRPKDVPEQGLKKDTWAYFRAKADRKSLTTAKAIKDALAAAYDNIAGDVATCVDETPHEGFYSPRNRAATRLDEGQMRDIAEDVTQGTFTVASGQNPSAARTDTGLLVRWDGKGGLSVLRADGSAATGGGTAFVLAIGRTKTFAGAKRRSVAACYETHPFVVSKWAFPMMRPSEASE